MESNLKPGRKDPSVFSFTFKLAFAVGLFVAICLSTASPQTPNQKSSVGRIVGSIDGISRDGDQTFVAGWACQQGQKKSIAVHVFFDSADGTAKRAFLQAGTANLYSEPAVGQACQDHAGGAHRFLMALAIGSDRIASLYVHGIRVVDGVANEAIAGSGAPLARLPVNADFLVKAPFPPPLPPALSGAYRGLAGHPGVFTTAAELGDLAARINRPASYSKERFGQLAGQIKNDLASRIDWDATYSGCNSSIYLFAFAYEPQEARRLEISRAALKPAAGAAPPAGAAVVAARLALYAALVKAGATPPADAPGADQAAGLAKRIMVAWATRGFPRDTQGRFQTSPSAFNCDDNGTVDRTSRAGSGQGLSLGRGVGYSVHAQDLLAFLGTLDAEEEKQLNAFHDALYDVIRRSGNKGFGNPHLDCESYSNGWSNELAALLAIARLLDDRRKFEAALNGGDRSIPVVPSWIRFFDHAIYGKADAPLDCYPNAGPDSLTSMGHGGYATATVAPGEIQDRYRNAHRGQGIGYPMLTLERLINAAEVLRLAGFDPYGYRGNHRQSIEMAIGYYACYGKGAGFDKTVTAENSGACPNAPQYYGKLVNDVDRMVQFGAYRFPGNAAIADVEAAAKRSTSEAVNTFSTDALLFGRWRD